MKKANITSNMNTLNADSFLKSVESFPPTLQELCDLYVQRVLDMCEGNSVRAARILGIGRTTLYRHRKRKGPWASQSFRTVCEIEPYRLS